MTEIYKSSYLKLSLLYFISYFLLLINFEGIYFDDYALYKHSWETLSSMFFQAAGYAGYFTASIHFLLLEIGVFSYRVLTFVLMFLVGYFFSKILEKLEFLEKQDIYFLTIFFLIAPLFPARIALIDFPYVLCSFLFYLAFFLLVRWEKNLNIFRKLFISLIFFVSFVTNSILFFYGIVIMFLLYRIYNKEVNFLQNVRNFVKSYYIFLFLPIVFFIIKIHFFKSSGLYFYYNKITLKGLLLAIPLLPFVLYLNFIEAIKESLNILSLDLTRGSRLFLLSIIIIPLTFVIIFTVVIRLAYFKETTNNPTDDKKNYFHLFIIGLLVSFIGLYPYIVVFKIPSLYDWDSRYQLLLNFGFAFIVYYGIKLLIKKEVQLTVLSFLISVFTLFQIHQFYKYYVDYVYQQAIVENFKSSDIIKNNNTFVVDNRLGARMANGRTFRFYELNGMSKIALGVDNKFYVLQEEDIEKYAIYKEHKQYNFSSWQYSKPVYIVIKDNLENQNIIIDILKLTYLNFFDKERFRVEVKKLVSIELKSKDYP